jgi:ribosomal protein S18 acetylase RimI-like enzyme
MSNLEFRSFRDEGDYPLLVEINHSSHEADHDSQRVTQAEIAEALARMEGVTPQTGVIIAWLDDKPVGYSRLGWYSSSPHNRLYYQISFLKKEYRGQNLWEQIIAENEERISVLAAGHPVIAERYFQAWASDHQSDWIAALEACGYRVARRFNNMLHKLDRVQVQALPAGVEIRVIGPEHMRAVWEALREMNTGLFENVDDDWLDEKYPEWLANQEQNPRFWQVAWAGDQLAGMVLARIDEEENERLKRNHGYTEHIYVRPAWRQMGLASALITRSLEALKEAGMTETELGVDAENESDAFRLYERLGFKTFYTDFWFRKPMASH